MAGGQHLRSADSHTGADIFHNDQSSKVRIVGDRTTFGIFRGLFEILPDIVISDCPTDEQQSIQHIILFGQVNDLLFYTCRLEVNGDQNIMVLILSDEFQDFLIHVALCDVKYQPYWIEVNQL